MYMIKFFLPVLFCFVLLWRKNNYLSESHDGLISNQLTNEYFYTAAIYEEPLLPGLQKQRRMKPGRGPRRPSHTAEVTESTRGWLPSTRARAQK